MDSFEFRIIKTTEPVINIWFDVTKSIKVTDGFFYDLTGDKWTAVTFERIKHYLKDIYDTDIELVN